jgi:hypothetical protein
MADLVLPPNVKLDPNTGLYRITNAQGKTIRVNADTQEQLNQYVKSVDTGVPATVTVTDPNTGNPRTQTFDSAKIVSQTDSINQQNALLTAGKRQAGVIGNNDGSYQDIRTGKTISQAEAAAKIQAAGLPPETLQAVTPKNSSSYQAAQTSINNTTNTPSNIPAADATAPSQAGAGNGSGPAVDASVQAAPAATTAANAVLTEPTPVPAAVAPPPALVAAAPPTVTVTSSPASVSVYSAVLNDGQAPGQIGTYFVQGPDGTVVEGSPGSTLDQARELASRLSIQSATLPNPATTSPAPVSPGSVPSPQSQVKVYSAVLNEGQGPGDIGTWYVEGPGGEIAQSGLTLDQARQKAADLTASSITTPNAGPNATPEQREAANQQALKQNLQLQAAIADQRRQINQGDWRVRLSLAPASTYLYNDPNPGILAPLSSQGGSDGVIFPYTPKIDLSYRADYTAIALTHSNYKGYFYQSSMLDPVNLTCTFTAQDTNEANYLLAVIHFFRSVTKMFYGQDPQRGAPPPLVYLRGLGEYQFAEHPCLVTQFNYSLPPDVDYIRARSLNVDGTNILARRKYNPPVATNVFTSVLTRLGTLFDQNIQQGAEPALTTPAPPTLGTNSPTYVPTKMDLSLILLPVQSRQQISQQFSLKKFSNGDLLKGGFW